VDGDESILGIGRRTMVDWDGEVGGGWDDNEVEGGRRRTISGSSCVGC